MIDNSPLQHYNQAKLFGETGGIPVRARRREAHTVKPLPEAAFGDKPLRAILEKAELTRAKSKYPAATLAPLLRRPAERE